MRKNELDVEKRVLTSCSDKAQVAAMIDLAVKTYGRLDATFNNAGINCAATPMAETDDEVFGRLININSVERGTA
jgi:NAD(P)-dependent dehydrogenase (short-subunit alcohol dehydrogenase family)